MSAENLDLTKYGFEKMKFNGSPPRVAVGMSGGVDSSVTAYILKWQGYDVVGLFMKNWEEQSEDGCCTAEADWADVKRVCEKIGIAYYGINFAEEYREKVFAEFLDGLKNGVTPNPDVLCNREIKFGPFLQHALKLNADYIATGHYAGILHENGRHILCRAADDTKDQSYFLCALSQRQLERVLFPLSDIKKTAVREIASALGLINAKKKDSTGICFIGERKIKQFLSTYLGNKKGEIRTLDERAVGQHDGLMYYTIGQRKGMAIGGRDGKRDTARWFVVRKDLSRNILYVNNGDCPELYAKTLVIKDFNEIRGFKRVECTAGRGGQGGEGTPNPLDADTAGPVGMFCGDMSSTRSEFNSNCGFSQSPAKTHRLPPYKCTAKIRYRQSDQDCTVTKNGGTVTVEFEKPQRAVTPGQWCVLYDGDAVIGGGVISGVGE